MSLTSQQNEIDFEKCSPSGHSQYIQRVSVPFCPARCASELAFKYRLQADTRNGPKRMVLNMTDVANQQGENSHPTTKLVPCRMCSTNIPDSAQKCVHCKSFQNWRRHLNFSSTVLSLLIALISVTATVGPNFIEWFVEKKPVLAVAVKRHTAEDFVIGVVNSGNAIATLNTDIGCRLWEILTWPTGQEDPYTAEERRYFGAYTFKIKDGEIIEPGAIKTISFDAKNSFQKSIYPKLELPGDLYALEYTVECSVGYLDSSGEIVRLPFKTSRVMVEKTHRSDFETK